ncbi:tRNA (adenosine(37)-N6)-dimethylallyltransferase MiaA [Alsobacter sp. R-9]
MAGRIRAILIAGPTASGKSALAVRLARDLGGVVVNADSMQVYRDLRIITARPTPEEEAAAPHRLFGHVDASVNHSVGEWLREATPLLQELWGQGKMPIVTGGTGLYFRALTQGLSQIPAVPETVRAAVRASSEGVPAPVLHDDLRIRDPATAATLRPTDRQRILRALEIFHATGRPLVSFHGEREGAVLDVAETVPVFLSPEREVVYSRIDARFDAMMSLGALEEVSALARRDLDPALPCMRAHGVPWLIRAIQGDMALPEAIERAKLDTRHYAKRQFTWFRHQAEGWTWAGPDEAEVLVRQRLGR